DHVALLEIVIFVPEIHRFFTELLDDRLIRVVVAVGAGKRDDAELHGPSTLAISKSSVTGFASSFSHISRVDCSAALGSPASSSTTMCRPTWTSRTAGKPRLCNASATVLPWGSRM